ncbi:fluoride efflux transporter CrcB [Enhydrobacter sp.]|jgi:CrcB protein|uniref:fluoride efflux transporter CrcB n=1 Tax=Enhydrobacter sp. TaxID=1894999 RepID=UPI00261CF84F|nr:fluoride efflux transporter CrcB [Enhydrobacter sp.]WIM12808.1 MAG: Fluoride ion transporter CrcB [Enhydrobacter sp.]
MRRWTAFTSGLALYAAVIAGGIFGSLMRWVVALVLPQTLADLPWPTLFANIGGCFIIGFFAALTAPDGRLFAGPRTRQFVMTGLCGGYTTFSTFSLEALHLFADGHLRRAVAYIVVSLVSWFIAVWFGDALAERLNR